MLQFQKKYGLIGLVVLTIGLIVSGCANTSIANPPPTSDPFYTYRWLALGVGILSIFIQVSITTSVNEQAGSHMAGQIFSSLFGIPLQWTILGEWAFRIIQGLASLWMPLIWGLSFLNGYLGNTPAILILTVLVGFVFPSPQLFYSIIIPLISGIVVHFVWFGILMWSIGNKASR